MKKQKRSTPERDPLVTGVGWYSLDQYARLLEASEDRGEMNSTWEGWEAKAREVLAFLRSEGVPAREVPIDVEEMIRWCKAQGKPVTGAARADFISLKCRELFGESHGRGTSARAREE